MHLGFSSMNTLFDPPPPVLARYLEERGFESLWYGEHSHIPCAQKTPYPGGGELPMPYKHMMDPYVSLMAAAGVLRETVAAMRALWRDEEAGYRGEYLDFDPVWLYPKPKQAGGPAIIFGAMGEIGVKHTAQWADGWFPVDIAMPDIPAAIAAFRQAVRDNGRDPDAVHITLQAMATPDFDTLKRYRDLGIHRVNVGVAIDMWDKPEQVLPMIDRFAPVIPQLAG